MNRNDRLVMLDKIQDETTAKAGGRPTSRREFIRTSAGLFLFVSAPIYATSACSDGVIYPGDVQTALQVAFLIAQAAILIGEIIKGDMRVDSPNTQCRTYEILMQLQSLTSDTEPPKKQLELKSVCKGQQNYSLEDWKLIPDLVGQYVLKTTMDGSTFESNPFDAKG